MVSKSNTWPLTAAALAHGLWPIRASQLILYVSAQFSAIFSKAIDCLCLANCLQRVFLNFHKFTATCYSGEYGPLFTSSPHQCKKYCLSCFRTKIVFHCKCIRYGCTQYMIQYTLPIKKANRLLQPVCNIAIQHQTSALRYSTLYPLGKKLLIFVKRIISLQLHQCWMILMSTLCPNW